MSAGTLAPVRGQFADACANWRRNEAWDCAWASCAWDAWFLVPACIAVTHPSTKKPLTINNNLRVADYNMQ